MDFINSLKDLKHWFEKKKVQFLMRVYAEKAIQIVHDITEKEGVPYWLMFGTLLGAYREHGLIKHDDDIDLGMFAKDLNSTFIDKLVASGFTFRGLKMTTDRRYRSLKIFYHGIQVDIYGFTCEDNECKHITGLSTQPLDGHDWLYSKTVNKYRVRLVHVIFEGLELCQFGKSFFMVFQNASKVLEDWYGEDFMIPVKGFHRCVSTSIEVLPEYEMTASIISYEELLQME